MLADRVAVRHRLHDFFREVVGVWAREPHAPDPVHVVHRAQQLGEPWPPARAPDGEVPAIRVHVLAEERDLHHSIVSEALDLGEDIPEGSRSLGTANERDDAERARVVAADADRHPGVMGAATAGRQPAPRGQGAREDLRVLAHVHLRTVGLRLADQVQQLGKRMRADHDVHPRGAALDQAAILLGQASGDDDAEPGVAVLQRFQVTEGPVEAVVSVLADGAGVQDDDLGVGGLGHRGVAVRLEQTRDPLGVVLVHLAPEGADQISAGHIHQPTSRTPPPGSRAPR